MPMPGSDDEVLDDELIRPVGRCHCDGHVVSTVCRFWCLGAGGGSAGVKPWRLGINYSAGLSVLSSSATSGDSPKTPSTL
jgi:hypothetical protein